MGVDFDYKKKIETSIVLGGVLEVGFVSANSQYDSKNGKIIIDPFKLNIQGEYEHLINDVLPHEVMHIITSDQIKDSRSPKWIEEGISIQRQGKKDKCDYLKKLLIFKQNGKFTAIKDLINDYTYNPTHSYDPEVTQLVHLEGYFLTNYLIKKGGGSNPLAKLLDMENKFIDSTDPDRQWISVPGHETFFTNNIMFNSPTEVNKGRLIEQYSTFLKTFKIKNNDVEGSIRDLKNILNKAYDKGSSEEDRANSWKEMPNYFNLKNPYIDSATYNILQSIYNMNEDQLKTFIEFSKKVTSMPSQMDAWRTQLKANYGINDENELWDGFLKDLDNQLGPGKTLDERIKNGCNVCTCKESSASNGN